MSFLKPEFLFKTSAPPELHQFIGRNVIIPTFVRLEGKRTKIDEKKVMIITIVGNRFQPQFYEINGEHLIGMLRFHAQMLGAKDITEEQMEKFEEMEIHADKLPTDGVKKNEHPAS